MFILSKPLTPGFLRQHNNKRSSLNIRCSSTGATRILVTSPCVYSARLTPLLIQNGYRPIWAPCITTTALEHASSIDKIEDAILRLSTFDVVAFTSRTGITEFVRYMLQFADNDVQVVRSMVRASGVKLAALGSDATSLRDTIGHTADIVPIESSPSGLVQFMAVDENLRGAHVLCPIPEVHGMIEPPIVPNFLHELEAAGFQTTVVPAYVTRPVGRRNIDVELGWLAEGLIEYVCISSVGEANALKTLLTDEEFEQLVDRVERTEEVRIVAHGPFTSQGIKDTFGMEKIVTSRDFSSFAGMAEAIAETERKRGSLLLPL